GIDCRILDLERYAGPQSREGGVVKGDRGSLVGAIAAVQNRRTYAAAGCRHLNDESVGNGGRLPHEIQAGGVTDYVGVALVVHGHASGCVITIAAEISRPKNRGSTGIGNTRRACIQSGREGVPADTRSCSGSAERTRETRGLRTADENYTCRRGIG